MTKSMKSTTTSATNNEKARILTNWNLIEEKWRQRWDQQEIFQSNADFARRKYFITVAYPYPNSPQHIGHGRTYTLADTHARYMRMKGYNVLFPMGFHYTGTPILGMSRRVASGDKELLEMFRKIFHISDQIIESFTEPVRIANYFHNEIKLVMKEMGYSIDWRREFTTIDKAYSKFISWQFRTLLKKGLIIQGSHPVGWCPKDENPVSQHDTIGDVEPDFNEYTVIKFRLEDDDHDDCCIVIPAATLRPETIYGVTNLWINPKIEYVRIRVDDELWIVSKDAAKKLELLNHKVTIESTINGEEIIGKHVKDPIKQTSIPLYPASFVEAQSGTGIVMSVPAHAPYDYHALEDLKRNIFVANNNKFRLNVEKIIEPITVIESEGYSSDDNDTTIIPAAQILKKFKAKNPEDPYLEEATNELYSHEFYKGKMSSNTGKYAGLSVPEAKEKIKKDIIAAGYGDIMFELVNKPVKCRCGTECMVKLLDDQWFINYGNKDWKCLAHQCLNRMDIVPEELRQEFEYVIDWLKERACARKTGLGTKLPWDQGWIIESLSDSVIYMAYYIIAKYVNNVNNDKNNMTINAEHLKDSFFDYVLLRKGDVTQVATECKISKRLIEDIRNEFSYFYPLDVRHSGRDLIPNHLSFFIFNHVAIFGKENWPKKIVVNGSVLMEGKKMSKSLGNIIPLRSAIKEYGVDAIRLAILISAELLQDADFSFDAVRGIQSKLYDIYNMALEQSQEKNNKRRNANIKLKEKTNAENTITELEDRWIISRLQYAIEDITTSMDKLRVREALHIILYSLDRDLQWYQKRIRTKGRENSVFDILCVFLEKRIRMLAPFAPFISEEIWEKIGWDSNKNDILQPSSKSIILAGWPQVDYDKKDPVAEESEHVIMNLTFDIQKIVRVTKLTPTKIVVYTSSRWKRQIYQKILASILLENKTNFSDLMKELVTNPETAAKSKSNPNLIRKMVEDILSDSIETRNRRLKLGDDFDEILPLTDAKRLLSLESGNPQARIIIYREEVTEGDDYNLSKKYDPKSKAKFARPFKPAIYIE
ncbi:MAG: leucine--tRNA ligase [Nitrososphaeraceae archaeon]